MTLRLRIDPAALASLPLPVRRALAVRRPSEQMRALAALKGSADALARSGMPESEARKLFASGSVRTR